MDLTVAPALLPPEQAISSSRFDCRNPAAGSWISTLQLEGIRRFSRKLESVKQVRTDL